MGGITFRIGDENNVEIKEKGHLGYYVKPGRRGNNYAARGSHFFASESFIDLMLIAVKLLMPIAKRYGLTSLIVIVEKANEPSRRVVLKLGGTLEEVQLYCLISLHNYIYMIGIHGEVKI